MKLATLAALLIAGVVNAATGTAALSFTRPTTYEDGSPMPASVITGYTVSCSFTPTGSTSSIPCTLTGSPLPGTAQSGSVTVTYPPVGGTACFVLYTMIGATLSDGSQPPVCKALPAVQPSDPTNLTVTITLALTVDSETPIRVAVAEPVVSVVRSPP